MYHKLVYGGFDGTYALETNSAVEMGGDDVVLCRPNASDTENPQAGCSVVPQLLATLYHNSVS